MTLKVKVNDPCIQYQSRARKDIDANLVILAQIHFKLLHRKAKLPRILSQNGQNCLEAESQ